VVARQVAKSRQVKLWFSWRTAAKRVYVLSTQSVLPGVFCIQTVLHTFGVSLFDLSCHSWAAFFWNLILEIVNNQWQ